MRNINKTRRFTLPDRTKRSKFNQEEDMAGPLAGVKVLDFTFYLPGPFCVFILTDLGADTIKVERVTPKASGGPPDKSETIRKAYDPRDRNKRSIALDLKSKEGKEIYLKLAAKSDVVVAEGRPVCRNGFGIGYEDIKKLNPKIIYCHISGFGYGGPMEQVPGFDPELCGFRRGAGPDRLTVPTASMSPPPNPSHRRYVPSGSSHGAVAIVVWLFYARERNR